jgi:uncharacterized membrane protein YccF (DUF307 family)
VSQPVPGQPPGAPSYPPSGPPPPAPAPGPGSPLAAQGPTGTPGWQPPVQPVETKEGPGLAVRALWFILVGWWLTGIVSAVAWVAMITIIGLPLGIWLINRIPTVITLRPRTREVQQMVDAAGFPRLVAVPIQQPPWWMRGLWFLLVGWWASAIVMTIGWLLIVLIITLPVGLLLYNRVPFVASLYRY